MTEAGYCLIWNDDVISKNLSDRLGLTSSAHAEWSLTEARQAAFARDAQLQWYQQQQAVIATKTAFAGQPENPTLSTTLENLGNSRLEQLDGPSMSVQYSQTWTRPSKLELREQVAGLAEQQRQLSLRQRQAEISAEVRLCLAEWAKSAANTAQWFFQPVCELGSPSSHHCPAPFQPTIQ